MSLKSEKLTNNHLKVKYFAWLRERIGVSEEALDIPTTIITVSDLIDHLSAINEVYAYAFEAKSLIRAAINKRHVSHEAAISGADEVAFFPPMTGG